MPANSMIVGVDLAPVKPIPRAITFQSDITTDKCRATIRQHLKTWKADTVLHDGAPNVGTAWVQDAFSQAELALQALKLATEFLIEGGTFVTKVFRSKDYNALLWVFKQLFLKVEATKPPSSRNVSAEIFVVCRGFKSPKKIDPKFLDPRSVFAELKDPTPNNEAKVFQPEKKKRRREGYEEGDYIQFKEVPASEFIQTTDPIAILGGLNKLSFNQQENGDIALAALDKLPETTDEIRRCCMDLKVLGRKEFRLLLRWRMKARNVLGLLPVSRSIEKTENQVAEITPMDEELQIQEDLQRVHENEGSRKKRERRRGNEKKQKEIVRMQMHMTTPTEIGLEQRGPYGEDSLFALAAVDRAGAVGRIAQGRMEVHGQATEQDPVQEEASDSDIEEDRLDEDLDVLYSQYQENKSDADAKFRAKKARKEPRDGDWEGFPDHEQSGDESSEKDQSDGNTSEDEIEANDSKSLLFPGQAFMKSSGGLTSRAVDFFDQDVFKDLGDLGVEEEDDGTVRNNVNDIYDGQILAIAQDMSRTTSASKPRVAQSKHLRESSQDFSVDECEEETTENEENRENGNYHDDNNDKDDNDFEIVKSGNSHWDAQGEPRKDGRLDIDIITAEAMTLAQQVASGKKSVEDLTDEGYNKYTFRDSDGLPEWFLDDEGRHSKPHRPISAAGAAAIKEKLRALNARPIKKVREAKDRKKFKAAQRLEKLRRKSALVADDEAISEKDKAKNIVKMMSKAAEKKPKQLVKLVVAKGGNRGISGRPRGVKGKYKIVDARLKKDVRADRRLAKKKR